jgi:hypothetical protein
MYSQRRLMLHMGASMIAAPLIRAASLSIWLTLAALVSSRAAAELPEQLLAGTFGPADSDFDLTDIEIPSTVDLHFGATVAMRNGIAFASIPFSFGGRVAVLNLTASGWQRVQTLNAPVKNAGFGNAIVFRDGIVVVSDNTSAYVYKRNSAGAWTLRQTLRPPATDSVTLFPLAVKYEAGTLIASASRNARSGLVYVFELGTDGRFFRRATLHALDSKADDGFGGSLSMTKKTLLMGSSGAAYIFGRNSLGNWVQRQKLLPVNAADGFGAAVAIDNDMIVIGAPAEDIETEIDTPDGHYAGGAAYVFLPVAGRYVESLRLRPRIDERFDYLDFGKQVAMFGRYIAIAASGRPTFESVSAEGLVFTYDRNSSAVLARGIGSAHWDSGSIALANNWLLVGHIGDQRCNFGCPGAAALYDVNRFQQ